MKKPWKKPCLALSLILLLAGPTAAHAQWSMLGGNPQHTGIATVAAQDLDQIRFQTPVDMTPNIQDGEILIHYGSPLVTPLNTLILPVKTDANNDFEINAFNAFNPTSAVNATPEWTLTTDYILPPHAWTPSFAPALTPTNQLYFPGAGGTVYRATNIDSSTTPVTQQISFYPNTAADNATTFINTPLTSDSQGDIYYGVQVASATGVNSAGVQSCLVRVGADGSTHTFNVTSIPGCTNIVQNCAPALSNDGSTIYVAVSNGTGGSLGATGYLVALDANTLAFKSDILLTDPSTGQPASLPDLGTSSPTIAPNGDVYFGVLASNAFDHNQRGWLLHFNANLSTTLTPGSFGWDDTVTIVPSSMVTSYTGTSSYLLMTKYNNYAGSGTGDGVNKIAILDPSATETDPINGVTSVMNEVLTQVGPTSEASTGFPNAVREWCINNAAVDPATQSVYANSEDGTLYRWNLATNTLSQSLKLTAGNGEAYTPTVIGPDGTVYAINDAILFAAGSAATSQIDLTNQSAIFHNVTVATATARIHDGYNAGGTLWNGAGLISSTARATPGTALGVMSGADYLTLYPGALFAGQTVSATDVLIKYTYTGDANLDGQITAADYAQIDTAFLLQLPNPTWLNGDFNYDGVVNYLDYALIDAAYLIQSGPLAAPMIDAHTVEFGDPYTLALNAALAAPEPSSLALAVVGTIFLLTSRRRLLGADDGPFVERNRRP